MEKILEWQIIFNKLIKEESKERLYNLLIEIANHILIEQNNYKNKFNKNQREFNNKYNIENSKNYEEEKNIIIDIKSKIINEKNKKRNINLKEINEIYFYLIELYKLNLNKIRILDKI